MPTNRAEHFSTETPGFQVIWDATSFKELLMCPRRYQYTILQHWRSKNESIHLSFGSAYHEALETWDLARAAGRSFDEAAEQALAKALSSSKDMNDEGPVKNRFTLVRSVMWYIYHWGPQDPATVAMIGPGGRPAVELSFMFGTEYKGPRTGEELILCGHLDGVVEHGGLTYVRERKTTKNTLNARFFDGFKPDTQIDLYSWAGHILTKTPMAGVIIDAVQVAVNFSRFGRNPVLTNTDSRVEFFRDVTAWFDMAEYYALANYWPKATRNCWNCEFRKICSQPTSVRPSLLDAEFKQHVWEPAKART